MNYRLLGGTGLKVSEVDLGAWFIGGMYGNVAVDEAKAIVRRALDLGINVFDTADAYGSGLSERVLGEVLRGYDVLVFTKVGYDIYNGNGRTQNFNPGYLRQAALKSMERLGRRINLLQLHNPPLPVIRDKSVYEVLRSLVNDGYVEHIGVALGPETNVLNEGLASIDMGYESIMFVFNAMEQEPARTLIRTGYGKVGLMVRVPHASGVLTDNFNPSTQFSDHRSLRRREWLIRASSVVNRFIKPIASELGLTLTQFAIKYILSYPVSTLMLTVTSIGELEEYVNAADGKYLDQQTLRIIEDIYNNNADYLKETT